MGSIFTFFKNAGFFSVFTYTYLSQQVFHRKQNERSFKRTVCKDHPLKCLMMIITFTRWTWFLDLGRQTFGWKLEICFICQQQSEVKKVQPSGKWSLSVPWRGGSCRICHRWLRRCKTREIKLLHWGAPIPMFNGTKEEIHVIKIDYTKCAQKYIMELLASNPCFVYSWVPWIFRFYCGFMHSIFF